MICEIIDLVRRYQIEQVTVSMNATAASNEGSEVRAPGVSQLGVGVATEYLFMGFKGLSNC